MRRYVAESLVLITISIVLALGTLAAGGLTLRDAVPTPELSHAMMPGCFDAPIAPLDDSGIAGQAALCLTDEAVRPSLRVANLTPDTAYQVVFAYFEEPGACQSFPCSQADLRADGTGGTLARMDATIAGGARRAEFWGDFRNLVLTRRAQVTLTLFDRGSAQGVTGQRRAHLLLALPGAPPDERSGSNGTTTAPQGRRVAQAIFLPQPDDAP